MVEAESFREFGQDPVEPFRYCIICAALDMCAYAAQNVLSGFVSDSVSGGIPILLGIRGCDSLPECSSRGGVVFAPPIFPYKSVAPMPSGSEIRTAEALLLKSCDWFSRGRTQGASHAA